MENQRKAIEADDVTKLFLAWATRDGDVITNLKLQKLLYYAQAWYMVNFSGSLFSDDIEAWQYGPVLRKVYNRYKKNRNLPIDYKPTDKEESIFTRGQLNFLKAFYSKFIGIPSHHLVNSSHNEPPWKNVFDYNDPLAGNIITKKSMKDYYSDLV